MKKTRKIDKNRTSHSKLNNNCKTTKCGRGGVYIIAPCEFTLSPKSMWDLKATNNPRPENHGLQYNERQIDSDINK